jgi:hypothetical protein
MHPGISAPSALPSGSHLCRGGKGDLVHVKQESGEEDELEDDYDEIKLAMIGGQGDAPMTLRQTLTKLAQLLADSVKKENDEPGGAG